jgi:hypothetical protein
LAAEEQRQDREVKCQAFEREAKLQAQHEELARLRAQLSELEAQSAARLEAAKRQEDANGAAEVREGQAAVDSFFVCFEGSTAPCFITSNGPPCPQSGMPASLLKEESCQSEHLDQCVLCLVLQLLEGILLCWYSALPSSS